MWALFMNDLANRTAYQDQKIWSMRTIKASVKYIYIRGQKVQSAVCTPSTKPIFRSESARYVLFIQMSKEMWDFDGSGSGEVMFSKVINGFLPELFKRWQRINARHLVTVILFTRMQYETEPAVGGTLAGGLGRNPGVKWNEEQYSDFYRVVVSDVGSGEWADILARLKLEFRSFLRDVSVRQPRSKVRSSFGDGAFDESPDWVISGQPCIAACGNILEAISLGLEHFSYDHIDRDLVRTGASIAIVTPGTGLFDVDHQLLVTTTDNLVANGIDIDLVCLARMPLHSVPLFRYKEHQPRARRQVMEEVQTHNVVSFDSSPPRSTASSTYHPIVASSPEDSTQSVEAEQDGWCIPYWIDVSFWTSPSEDGSEQPKKLQRLSGTSLKSSSGHLHKPFRPRVRMYELQMLGVMEDAMANISIPYMMPTEWRVATSMASGPAKHVLNQEPSSGDLRVRSLSSSLASSLPFSPNWRAKATPTSRQLIEYITLYDEEIFRNPNVGQTSALRQSRWTSSKRTMRRPGDPKNHPYKPSLLPGNGPSFKETYHSLLANHAPNVTTQSLLGSQSSHVKASTKSVKKGMESKSRRFPRQFSSLGPRGFGIAAPKAIASTELTAEHAQSRSLLGQSLRLQISKNPTSAISTKRRGVKPGSSLINPHSPSSSIDRQEHSPSSDSDAHGSSRPIAIRKTTAIRIQDDSDDSHSQHEHTSIKARKRDHSWQRTSELDEEDLGHHTVTLREAEVSDSLHSRNTTRRTGMAPWLTIVNPSNPKPNISLLNRLGRWQHVFPRPLRASNIKWKSLCSPAAVPLTTEDFPTAEQLSEDYDRLAYSMDMPKDDELSEQSRSSNWLLREMISLRLSYGYQIAVRSEEPEQLDVFDKGLSAHGEIKLFKGGSLHVLRCVEGNAIRVICFSHHSTTDTLAEVSSNEGMVYKPSIRTMLAETYTTRTMKIIPKCEHFDWRELDALVAGHGKRQLTEIPEGLPFWRARFVLIPIDPPSNHRRPLQPLNEDNDEEVRLEGIRKLTQMWQKFRYVPADERRFQPSTRSRKDTNPLDIMYQTRDLSAIVAAEKENMAENAVTGKPAELLLESELFQRSNPNLDLLAQIIQGEKGIRMRDRRWHWRLHYNCFIGFEFTSWLLQNVRDIDTRDDAVEYGNELMKKGLFEHVEQRHNFRDGNYFYQIASDYRAPRPEASTWFGSRKPVFPIQPPEDAGANFPTDLGSRAGSNAGEKVKDDALTPTTNKQTLGVVLSKSMLYDVDHRKRSYRPELITLHYDRLHNPDNCYHIRIDWLNVTSKFIEDAIVSWATTAERFGLRLVEVPLTEASAITDIHPFRAPYRISLAHSPPDKQPKQQAYLDAKSFSSHDANEKHLYQKSILKNFEYVLDFEAANDFPQDVDVAYSWGKPDYKYPQYIHRSGKVLAQITDEGDFMLLANRLYNDRDTAVQDTSTSDLDVDRRSHAARTAGFQHSPRASPFSSPMIRPTPEILPPHQLILMPCYRTPEQLMDELQNFCHNESALETLYSEILNKPAVPGQRTPYLEGTIPAVGLPPSLSLGEGGRG